MDSPQKVCKQRPGGGVHSPLPGRAKSVWAGAPGTWEQQERDEAGGQVGTLLSLQDCEY